MKDELQKALCDLKNNIIEMAKENEELRDCVDAQQDTIAAANQLIAKLKAEISLLTAINEAAIDATADAITH